MSHAAAEPRSTPAAAPGSTVETGTTGWTFAQYGLLIVCVAQLVWAAAGFIAEPSFSTAADAPTEQVLGVDFNGWHALSGLLLFGPGLLLATRPAWAVVYALYAGVLLVITGVWALFSTDVALVFTFPNNESDAILHLITGAVLLGVAASAAGRGRSARHLPSEPPA